MRFTAEFRGGDNDDDPDEWCVVDESIGLCGSAVLYDLTESVAKKVAKLLNNNIEEFLGES